MKKVVLLLLGLALEAVHGYHHDLDWTSKNSVFQEVIVNGDGSPKQDMSSDDGFRIMDSKEKYCAFKAKDVLPTCSDEPSEADIRNYDPYGTVNKLTNLLNRNENNHRYFS
jgi:hypothetical protein